MNWQYRNPDVEMTVKQLKDFMFEMLPFGRMLLPPQIIVEAAMSAGFFVAQKGLKPFMNDRGPLFIFPKLGGISDDEVDRRMAKLAEEIVDSVNQATAGIARSAESGNGYAAGGKEEEDVSE